MDRKETRVWHIPQVPGNPFHVPVQSLGEAVLVLDALAAYDKFQLDNNIKGDYCNVQGLEVLEDGEWVEWYDDINGKDIGEYMAYAEYDAA